MEDEKKPHPEALAPEDSNVQSGELPLQDPQRKPVVRHIIMKLTSGETIMGEVVDMDFVMGIATLAFPHTLENVVTQNGNMIWMDDWIPYSKDTLAAIMLRDCITILYPTESIIKTYNELVTVKLMKRMPLYHQSLLAQANTSVAN